MKTEFEFWLLIDLGNGHYRSKNYCWIFDSYKDAMRHRRWQLKDPSNAKLTMPIRCNSKRNIAEILEKIG